MSEGMGALWHRGVKSYTRKDRIQRVFALRFHLSNVQVVDALMIRFACAIACRLSFNVCPILLLLGV